MTSPDLHNTSSSPDFLPPEPIRIETPIDAATRQPAPSDTRRGRRSGFVVLVVGIGVLALGLVSWFVVPLIKRADVTPTVTPTSSSLSTPTVTTIPRPSSIPTRSVTGPAASFGPIVVGGKDYDFFAAVVVASDGSIIVAGYTSSTNGDLPPSRGIYDGVVAKFSPAGTMLWATNDGGTNNEEFRAVALAPDGSIVAAGVAGPSALIAKFSSDGKRLWAHSLGGGTSPELDGVAVASDGSIIAAGGTPLNTLLVKLDPDGTVVWARTSDGSGIAFYSAVALTDDGGIIAVGRTTSTDGNLPPARPSIEVDALLVKYTPDGTIQWARTGGDAKAGLFLGVAVTGDGSIVVTGRTEAPKLLPKPPTDEIRAALLAKYSSDGELQWVKTDSHPNGVLWSVGVTTTGDLVAAGHTLDNVRGGDTLLARYGPDGALRWARTDGGSKSDLFFGVAIAGGGTIVAAGSTDSVDGDFPSRHSTSKQDIADALLVCYSPDGTLIT